MKKILVFVSSLDGKTTKWDNPFVRSWSSKADQSYFIHLWKKSALIVAGSGTYDAEPFKPYEGQHIVVMTRNVSRYQTKAIPGQLEFSDETPAQLVQRFVQKNQPQMLIAGGAQLATSFLTAGLVDELWLTIEPKIFGQGNSIVIAEKLDIQLKLLNCEKLNEAGTLLTKYAVL
ncbi:MAG: dihydrofolate reductase family protein [Lentimicrobiaceae bacterium]|jgi:dihydrofolate reductase|nr:dihydrofolate reductase family protein [Lentimicrobiaceae bacterium]MDD4596535.1 dihydrofolate reductase family protein [Lentimicrobiaceae bacterium]MDY0026774.1 dihydrofolate reductase family protein [Lentimicrobium sp.]